MRKIFRDADLLDLGYQDKCCLGGNANLLDRAAAMHNLISLERFGWGYILPGSR